MIHAPPAKIVQKAMQTGFHAMDIHVMAEPGLGADARNAGLFGVNFPRMEIEDRGELIGMIYPAQHPAGEAVGHQPEIAATACRPVAIEEAQRRRRNFHKTTHGMRVARGIRHPIVVMANRIDARTVEIARSLKTFEGPHVGMSYGETGGPVSLDFLAGQVFENQLGQVDVGKKCGFALVCGPFMTVPVACNFVPRSGYALYQRRVPFCYPAQREERCTGAMLIKHCENAIDVAFDAALAGWPFVARNMRRKRRYLKIILDVDRQRIGNF